MPQAKAYLCYLSSSVSSVSNEKVYGTACNAGSRGQVNSLVYVQDAISGGCSLQMYMFVCVCGNSKEQKKGHLAVGTKHCQ